MAKKNGFRDFGHLVPHQMARWIAADGKHENQPMTEPDENPVIATLLEDAARLAPQTKSWPRPWLLPSKRGWTRLSTPIANGSSRGAGS